MAEEFPLVSIQCLVYNHESYLRQCLDGFVMQQTNFPFEAIVHDDASTDGSAAIIREYAAKYPDIIKPIYEVENQYCKEGFGYIFAILNDASHGKYIAFCEGDDYWTDPLKLQKQVDVLEKHEEYGCVYTAYKIVDMQGTPLDYSPSIQHMQRSFTGDVFRELLVANFPQTLTILYRKDLLAYEFTPPYVVDFSLFLSLAIQKPFYYLPEITGVYRINPEGMVQSGELGERYDFMAIELFYFVEYLRSKQLKRNKIEDRRIKKLLFTKWCNVWKIKRYYKYFVRIVWYSPSYIITIPLCLMTRFFKRMFPR